MKTLTLLKHFLLLLILGLFLSSCGTVDKLKSVRKPVDLTKEPLDPMKELEETFGKVEVFL